MQLIDWLHQEKVSMETFGERIGCAQSIVSRICNRKHEPRAKTARNIVVMTKGQVTANELLGIPKKFWKS